MINMQRVEICNPVDTLNGISRSFEIDVALSFSNTQAQETIYSDELKGKDQDVD